MKGLRRDLLLWLVCVNFLAVAAPLQASEPAREYVTTTPALLDGVLYVASTMAPMHRGRLRAIDILDTFPVTLWDAAERMPQAGTGAAPGELPGSDPPALIRRDNRYRSLFSSLGRELVPLTAESAGRLQPFLKVVSLLDAEVLLHAVRGRRGGTAERPSGATDDPWRLWGLSRSSPVLVGASAVDAERTRRDRVLYVGADDGMLHAFFVSRYDTESGYYRLDDPDGGAELWAYLPGSFLPHLQDQPRDDYFAAVAIALDGSPVVRELFFDLDGDGRREWHTLLSATGTIADRRRSCLFVLDISDPYQPVLLWEKLLPGAAAGRTRGLAIDSCGTAATSAACLYLTADFTGDSGPAGIHALALTLDTGRLLWQFSAPYQESGVADGVTPAVPALMDLAGKGRSDTLVFGDMVGQLWALNLEDGRAYGDAPAFVVPGGETEPIGAGVAVHNRVVIFGTGGAEGTDDNQRFSLYAVEILAEGSHLRWSYPLLAGEKVWEAPVLDDAGQVLFATASNYAELFRHEPRPTSGRIVALDRGGDEELSREAGAAVLGRVATAPGVSVSVSLTGDVTQFGVASRLRGPIGGPGQVKILSWRPL